MGPYKSADVGLKNDRRIGRLNAKRVLMSSIEFMEDEHVLAFSRFFTNALLHIVGEKHLPSFASLLQSREIVQHIVWWFKNVCQWKTWSCPVVVKSRNRSLLSKRHYTSRISVFQTDFLSLLLRQTLLQNTFTARGYLL